MTYVIGAIAGLVFGGVIGQLKNIFIWQRYLRGSASDSANVNEATSVYSRVFISYFVNILTLAAAFFVGKLLPFSGIAFLIGTAVALSLMNKSLAMKQKKQETGRRED